MKQTKSFLSVAIAAGLLASCSDDSQGKFEGIIDVPVTDEITLSRSEADVNEGLNKFSFDFFNAVAENHATVLLENQTDGNLSVSPVSAAMCMALLANSGDDALTSAISAMLGFNDLETLNSTCNKLMRFLPSEKNGAKLMLANSVWYNNYFTARDEFIKSMGDTYFAEVNGIDLTDQSSVETVNNWCSTKTGGLIPHVLENIDPGCLAVIANAMYFQGEWDVDFDENLTRPKDFHGTVATTEVDMMHSDYSGFYYADSEAEAISIGFNGSTSMWLVLPKDGTTAEELSKNMTASKWNGLIEKPESRNIHLDVPRFKIESSAELNDAFSSLGLTCRFSGLDKLGINLPGQFITRQKTSTEIDEKGATLAAATVTDIYWNISTQPAEEDVTLTFDHPFLYLIQNNTTGSILMAGRICNL